MAPAVSCRANSPRNAAFPTLRQTWVPHAGQPGLSATGQSRRGPRSVGLHWLMTPLFSEQAFGLGPLPESVCGGGAFRRVGPRKKVGNAFRVLSSLRERRLLARTRFLYHRGNDRVTLGFRILVREIGSRWSWNNAAATTFCLEPSGATSHSFRKARVRCRNGMANKSSRPRRRRDRA